MTAFSPDRLTPSASSFSRVDEILAAGQDAGASDIHLAVNSPPVWRLHGTLQAIWPNAAKLTAPETAALAEPLLNDAHKAQLTKRGDVDFAYANAFGR